MLRNDQHASPSCSTLNTELESSGDDTPEKALFINAFVTPVQQQAIAQQTDHQEKHQA